MPNTDEFCPECGADLSEQNIVAHSQYHWPDNLPDYPQYKLARERQALLRDMQFARDQRKFRGPK